MFYISNNHNRQYKSSSLNNYSIYYNKDSTAKQLSSPSYTNNLLYIPPNDFANKKNIQYKHIKQPQQTRIVMSDKHRYHILNYTILLTFTAAVITIMALMAIYSTNMRQIESLNSELHALNNINATRQAEIYANLDIEHIEYIAKTYLNMAQPEDFQIVEIFVNPQSFFSHSEDLQIQQNNRFSFARLWELLIERN